MAEKKVYFYKVSLHKETVDKEEDFNLIKPLFEDVLRSYSTNSSLVLVDSDEKVTLDIKYCEGDFLFGTLGKIRDNSNFQFRNKKTSDTVPILSPEEQAITGIECFTYFLLDYSAGILSIVASQTSPKGAVLNNLLAKYCTDFFTEIKPIPHPKFYRQLFSPKSTLSKVTYNIL